VPLTRQTISRHSRIPPICKVPVILGDGPAGDLLEALVAGEGGEGGGGGGLGVGQMIERFLWGGFPLMSRKVMCVECLKAKVGVCHVTGVNKSCHTWE